MRKRIRFSRVAVALVLAGGLAMAGKGGNGGGGGKPGGGGGGGGGDTPPADLEIVYIVDGDIRAMNATGGSQWTVLGAPSVRGRPDWSPDGTQVVFDSILTKSKRDVFDSHGVYVVNVDGSDVRKLAATTNGVSDPAWSPVAAPDGNEWILFHDQGPNDTQDVFAVRPDGTGLVNLTNTDDRWETEIAWSPDGKQIAVTMGREDHVAVQFVTDVHILTLGVVDGALAVVTDENLSDAPGGPLKNIERFHSLSWSRDGAFLAVAARRDSNIGCDLWVVNVDDGSDATNITPGDAIGECQPSWSPDGTLIAFQWLSGSSNPDNGIYVIEPDGTGETRISAGERPRWRR
jgi:Tol biopolymer transport system component